MWKLRFQTGFFFFLDHVACSKHLCQCLPCDFFGVINPWLTALRVSTPHPRRSLARERRGVALRQAPARVRGASGLPRDGSESRGIRWGLPSGSVS